MKVFIICSKKCYFKIPEIKEKLEKRGIEVVLPNCYDNPETEEKMWQLGADKHSEFKAKMYKESEKTTSQVDAVLVLNLHKFERGKEYMNYIGGATFLEMYDAFRLGKKIYLYNDIPQGILYDEIHGFAPIILNRDLNKIN